MGFGKSGKGGGMPWAQPQQAKGWGGKSAGKSAGKGSWTWTPAPATKVWQTEWTKPQTKGWGKAAGKGKGKGKGKESKPPTPLPANFKANGNIRYQGTVSIYKKLSGFGLITMKKTGVVPEDKLFVYWDAIKSEDRFPMLTQEMYVEFNLEVYDNEKSGVKAVRAKDVSLPGGGLVCVQDAKDAEKKTFVGGQDLRYTGTLKFYKAKDGFGYITVDDGYAMDEEVPKDIRVERAEVNCGGENPRNLKNVKEVEFGIWKNQKGVFKAYNMTHPGGLPIDVNAAE